MRKILTCILIISFFCCKSQNLKTNSFEALKIELINFLEKKGDINTEKAVKFKKGDHTFNLRGVINNTMSGELINGMYAFSSFMPHKPAYFVLVEEDKFEIIDISTRNNLDLSIKNTLDFCERNKYCVDITEEYITILISVFYNINNNLQDQFNRRTDINCSKGFNDKTKLP